MGKTQLAIEYAYRHAGEYDAVLWVGADGAEQAAANLARQALELKLPGVTIETPQDDALRAVLAWLEHTPGWLLIFDNANHPDEVRPLLPRSLGLDATSGHVLITSRHRDWAGTARSVGVPVWSREESLQFVQERTGQDAGASADALCEALGDLPLAVAQACGYITARQTAIAEYLELFQTRRAELWEHETPPDAYHGTVTTTWSLALEQLSATAAALLRVCSCLAPEPIPDGLFRTELPEEAHASLPADLQTVLSDRLAYQEACAALLRYSLLEINAERLQVHRLVQTVVRDSEPEDESWPTAALCLVRHSLRIDRNDPRTAYTAAPLVPHALTVAEYAERNETDLETASWLLDSLATGAQCRGDLASARDLMQRAIAIDEKAYEPDHPTLGVCPRIVSHAGCGCSAVLVRGRCRPRRAPVP